MKIILDLEFLPDYSVEETVNIAKTLESYGFGSICVADEVYYRDSWVTSTYVAMNTRSIGIGLGALGVYMRPPMILAQALATLDEVSGGRVYGLISTGNLDMLSQLGIKIDRPVAAVREAIQIMRMTWSGRVVTYEGKIFKIRDVVTSSRSIRGGVPIFIGAMGGPKLHRLGGEIADGLITWWGTTKEYYRYALENIKLGILKSKRKLTDIELIGGTIFACAKTGEEAREIVRPIVAFYINSIPSSVMTVQNIDTEKTKTISQCLSRGDYVSAIEATDDSIVDRLSLCGTPDEVVDKIEKNFVPYGFRRVSVLIPDNKTYEKIGVARRIPTIVETLRVMKEKVMPHLSD